MGLEMNLEKTKAMVCTPGFIWGNWGELAYKGHATGEGATLRERNKTRVICYTCGVTVVTSYLKSYMARNHGIRIPQTRWVDVIWGGLTTYVVSLPKVIQEVRCQVPGCPAVAHRAVRLHEHFMYRHFISKMAVIQEGKEPLPCCEL